MIISIVIPVYNTAKYLNECLDSICKQTYSDLQIICVDDGSRDNSLGILEEYARRDARIEIYKKKNEGKGAASARNMGLKNATGDYVLFLDSDDFFEYDMIKKLVDKINKTNSEVVIFKAKKYDDKLKTVIDYEKIELEFAPAMEVFCYQDCSEHIFQIGDLIAWNKIYKKTLLDEYKLEFEAIPISDDQYVPALAMVFAKRISIINEAFVNYRMNTGTSQCDSQSKYPEAAYQATYSIVERLKDERIYDVVKKSYLNMAMRLMREYFDKMQSYENMKYLYDKYIYEVFPILEATDLPEDYFYDYRIGLWYKLIINNSLEELLFKTSRAYGSKMTTAILRFRFPYDEVEPGSKIVLVGKGMIGRYWFSQLLLSEYAEVVMWVDSKIEIPENLLYDVCVVAN